MSYYDTCALAVDSDDKPLDTHWLMILRMNAILYFALTCFTFTTCIGTVFWPLTMIGCFFNSLGCLAQLVVVIITGAHRWKSDSL